MRSGDRCQKCNNGVMGVYKTQRSGDNNPVTRYLKCPACGETGKSIVAPEWSRRKIVRNALSYSKKRR